MSCNFNTLWNDGFNYALLKPDSLFYSYYGYVQPVPAPTSTLWSIISYGSCGAIQLAPVTPTTPIYNAFTDFGFTQYTSVGQFVAISGLTATNEIGFNSLYAITALPTTTNQFYILSPISLYEYGVNDYIWIMYGPSNGIWSITMINTVSQTWSLNYTGFVGFQFLYSKHIRGNQRRPINFEYNL